TGNGRAERLCPARPGRARPVPRLRRLAVAGGGPGPQAHAVLLPRPGGGVSGLTFAPAPSTAVYVAALFFVGFFNLGAWGAVYPYTSELFPTRLRSTAFGMAEGVGKAAAIAGPYLFGYLLDTTGATVWSLTFVAAVMTAGALVTLLGRETRGAKLT